MDNHFSTNLKFLRNKNSMTQNELAKRLNKDYSTIGKWELGQRNPVMADIIKISEIFNITIPELVGVDLRFNNNQTNDSNNDFETFEKVLKSKGIIDENDKISQDDFNRLMAFIDNNKDLLIKKDRD